MEPPLRYGQQCALNGRLANIPSCKPYLSFRGRRGQRPAIFRSLREQKWLGSATSPLLQSMGDHYWLAYEFEERRQSRGSGALRTYTSPPLGANHVSCTRLFLGRGCSCWRCLWAGKDPCFKKAARGRVCSGVSRAGRPSCLVRGTSGQSQLLDDSETNTKWLHRIL